MFIFEWLFCIPHIIFTAPALLTIISSPFPKKPRPQTEQRHFALNITRSNGKLLNTRAVRMVQSFRIADDYYGDNNGNGDVGLA